MINEEKAALEEVTRGIGGHDARTERNGGGPVISSIPGMIMYGGFGVFDVITTALHPTTFSSVIC